MPLIPHSLINLSALTTPASLVTATIADTSAPFPVGGAAASSVPTTCSAIMKNANSMTADTFLAQYKLSTTSPDSSIKTNLQNFKNSLLPPVDQGQTIPITGANSVNAASLEAIKRYLSTLGTTTLPVLQLVNSCLQEKESDSSLTDATNAMIESKSRLDAIKAPETHVSYYEGWFPIVRPMTERALFGLFGSALLMLIVSVLLFLRMRGVIIDIHIPEMVLPFSFSLPQGSQYYIYGGAAVGIVAAYIAFRRGNTIG